MGHVLFIIVHLFALIIFFPALLVTICLHIMYCYMTKGNDNSLYMKCPSCAELILKEAKVCKHCGQKVIPMAKENN